MMDDTEKLSQKATHQLVAGCSKTLPSGFPDETLETGSCGGHFGYPSTQVLALKHPTL
jgi:hypothetical protein